MLVHAAHAGWSDGGLPRSARTHSALVQLPSPLDTPAARRLLETAAEVARRLGRVCPDWPDDRFGELVYRVTIVRLRAEMLPDAAVALRGEYEAHHDAYVAALRAPDTRPGR